MRRITASLLLLALLGLPVVLWANDALLCPCSRIKHPNSDCATICQSSISKYTAQDRIKAPAITAIVSEFFTFPTLQVYTYFARQSVQRMPKPPNGGLSLPLLL